MLSPDSWEDEFNLREAEDLAERRRRWAKLGASKQLTELLALFAEINNAAEGEQGRPADELMSEAARLQANAIGNDNAALAKTATTFCQALARLAKPRRGK